MSSEIVSNAIEVSLSSPPLGIPLPMDEHACSVAMPKWEHVVGYEVRKVDQSGVIHSDGTHDARPNTHAHIHAHAHAHTHTTLIFRRATKLLLKLLPAAIHASFITLTSSH